MKRMCKMGNRPLKEFQPPESDIEMLLDAIQAGLGGAKWHPRTMVRPLVIMYLESENRYELDRAFGNLDTDERWPFHAKAFKECWRAGLFEQWRFEQCHRS